MKSQKAAKRHSGQPRDATHHPTSKTDAGPEVDHWAASGVIYGLIPVVEALRAGKRQIEQITIAEGARQERLRELLELAKRARVPVHRVPKIYLDRSLGDPLHQGVVARLAAARYHEADEVLDGLASRIGTDEPPLALGL
ncbi:MAG: RNA methyltransferase substrate-binding domain-containing protein, partial [Pyrinomonadaceae bacterium]